MSYSVFMVILCRILESHFERNESKADYSKKEKKKKCRHSFAWLLVRCISTRKKKLENHKSVGAGARKIEKIVVFLSKFDLHFFNICIIS